jgi:hypothetical protein
VFFSNPSQSVALAGRLNRPRDYPIAGKTLCRLHAADPEERSFYIAMSAARVVDL